MRYILTWIYLINNFNFVISIIEPKEMKKIKFIRTGNRLWIKNNISQYCLSIGKNGIHHLTIINFTLT